MGESLLVTGATGFIGTRIVTRAVDRGYDVRALRRDTSDTAALSNFDVDWHTADVRDADRVASAVRGCEFVVHAAGVSLKNADAETVRAVNVEGTRTVLQTALDAGVDRLVYTSSAGALGNGGIVSEDDSPELDGAYQHSKAAAEDLVREFTGRGLDGIIVNPTVFGPGDTKFTQRVLRLAMDPKLPVYFPGGANVVWVEDVAAGHLDALERGSPGERYILGGENLTYEEILTVISRQGDGSKPPLRIPKSVVHTLGPVAGTLDRLFGVSVFPFSTKMARMATRERFYTTEKAKAELDYSPTPFENHVDEAIDWHTRDR